MAVENGWSFLIVRLFRLARVLAACVPLPLGYWIAGWLGELYYFLNPGHSQHAVNNLAVVLAQHPRSPAVRRLARRSFRYYAMYLLDFLRLPAYQPTRVEAMSLDASVDTRGWEHMDAALARGRGVILVAAHFGNWEQAAPLFGPRGYKVNILVDTFKSAGVDAEVQRTRAAFGHHLIAASSGAALRQLYTALRHNEIVVLLVDRPLQQKGNPVSFFGRTTLLPSGPAMLALRTGATVLHGYVVRRPDLVSHHMVVEPPIEPPLTGNRAVDERLLMQAIVDRLQRVIQQYPEQWYMFRTMWPDDRVAGRDAGTGAAEVGEAMHELV